MVRKDWLRQRYDTLRAAMSSVRYILLVGLVASFVGRASAQSGSCLDRAIPAYVFAKRERAVAAPRTAGFKASVNGKRIVVIHATYNDRPRRIVILIDVSGSMSEPGKLKYGLVFARDLISLASPQTPLALLTFSDRIEDVVPFGRGRAAVLAEVDKLQGTDWASVKGVRRTAIRDSLLSALALFKKPALGDAICVITDGGDNASHASKSKVETLLESDGVRVYVVATTVDLNSRGLTPEEVGGPSEMDGLADATGGASVVFAPKQIRNHTRPAGEPIPILSSDREYLLNAAQAFYVQISSSIKLDLRLPRPLLKASKLKLEVVDASGRRNKDLLVIYPHRLAPCTPGETR